MRKRLSMTLSAVLIAGNMLCSIPAAAESAELSSEEQSLEEYTEEAAETVSEEEHTEEETEEAAVTEAVTADTEVQADGCRYRIHTTLDTMGMSFFLDLSADLGWNGIGNVNLAAGTDEEAPMLLLEDAVRMTDDLYINLGAVLDQASVYAGTDLSQIAAVFGIDSDWIGMEIAELGSDAALKLPEPDEACNPLLADLVKLLYSVEWTPQISYEGETKLVITLTELDIKQLADQILPTLDEMLPTLTDDAVAALKSVDLNELLDSILAHPYVQAVLDGIAEADPNFDAAGAAKTFLEYSDIPAYKSMLESITGEELAQELQSSGISLKNLPKSLDMQIKNNNIQGTLTIEFSAEDLFGTAPVEDVAAVPVREVLKTAAKTAYQLFLLPEEPETEEVSEAEQTTEAEATEEAATEAVTEEYTEETTTEAAAEETTEEAATEAAEETTEEVTAEAAEETTEEVTTEAVTEEITEEAATEEETKAPVPAVETEPLQLKRVTDLEINAYWVSGGGELLYTDSDTDGYRLIDMFGNDISEAIYTYDFSYNYGFYTARTVENYPASYCILNAVGQPVTEAKYDQIDLYSSEWAAAYTWVPAEEDAEEYDFRRYEDGEYKNYNTGTVDFYYLPTGELKLTLDRDHFEKASSYGHSLNILDRETQIVTTYNKEMNILSTEAYSVYDKSYCEMSLTEVTENGKLGLIDEDGEIAAEPVFNYISYNDGIWAEGNIDGTRSLYRLGDGQIVSTDCSYYMSGYYNEYSYLVNTSVYEAYGYIGFSRDQKLGYLNTEGEVTCEPEYSTSDYYNQGLSAYHYDSDNKVLKLLAADGILAEVEDVNSGYPLYKTSGYLYSITNEDYKKGLADWHGNILFACEYSSIDLSGNGRYIGVRKSYGDPMEIYQIMYPDVEEEEPEAETTEEETTEENTSEAETEEVTTEEVTTEEVTTEELTTEEAATEEVTTEEQTTEEAATEEVTTEEQTTEEATTEEATTEEPTTEEATTEEVTTEAPITFEEEKELLDSALMYLEYGPVSNQNEIIKLLTQAEELLSEKDPTSAQILQTAIEMMQENPMKNGSAVRQMVQLVRDLLD